MKNLIKISAVLMIFALQIQKSDAISDDYVYKAEFKKAYGLYSNSFAITKNAVNYYEMCKITYYYNDFKTASSYCKSAITALNGEEEDKELRANILALQGDIYYANSNNKNVILEHYAQAAKLKGENTDKFELARLYVNMAKTYNRYGDGEIAFDNFVKKAEEIINAPENKDNKKYNLLKAEISKLYADKFKAEKNYDKSKEYLDKALIESTDTDEYKNYLFNAEIYKEIANYYETHKKNKALMREYYEKYADETEKFPFEADIKDRINAARMKTDELISALEEFPYDIDMNIEAGYRYITDNEAAEKYFNKAIKINPESGYTYLAIAGVYCEAFLKTRDIFFRLKMSEYIEEAEKRAKYSPKIYKSAGLMKLTTGSYKSADLYYNKYVAYAQDRTGAECLTASDYIRFGKNRAQTKKAISYLEDALKRDSNIDDTYKLMLVSAYKKEGNTAKAEKTIKKYLQDNTSTYQYGR